MKNAPNDALRHWLWSQGLTQDEFAQSIDRTRRTVASYLSGEMIPPVPVMLQIEALTGIKAERWVAMARER